MPVISSTGSRGFSLVELLLAVAILSTALSVIYITYTKLLERGKAGATSVESQLEGLIGVEIVRLDLEHIGYGVALDEVSPVAQWDSPTKTFTIRSNLINTRQETVGWVFIDCSSGNCNPLSYSLPSSGRYYIFFVDSFYNNSVGLGQVYLERDGSLALTEIPPIDGLVYKQLVGFPIPDTVYKGSSNNCENTFCSRIRYKLRDTSTLPLKCNPNTGVLYRIVNNAVVGDPIFNCVADFQVKITATDGEAISVRKGSVKKVEFFILLQEGERRRGFTFSNTRECGGGVCFNTPEVDLHLPPDYQNYNWKVIKLSVKPKNS
ncbi:MAG: type II secretion system protein [Aquificae bacterium]|nr:type II secretion system protein [Aquificota bacterium]